MPRKDQAGREESPLRIRPAVSPALTFTDLAQVLGELPLQECEAIGSRYAKKAQRVEWTGARKQAHWKWRDSAGGRCVMKYPAHSGTLFCMSAAEPPRKHPGNRVRTLEVQDPDTQPERPAAEGPSPGSVREVGGPSGPEPTRYGDWEKRGRCIDF